MSVLTAENIAVLVRRRMGTAPETILRYVPLIDDALRKLAYDAASNGELDDWLTTDPSVTTATLDANGVCDMTALIANPRIILEGIPYGDVYHSSSKISLRILDNPNQMQLAGQFDALQLKGVIQGNKLLTKSPDNNATPLSGSLSFSVVFWPTLALLPEPLVERLIDIICSLLSEAPQKYEEAANE